MFVLLLLLSAIPLLSCFHTINHRARLSCLRVSKRVGSASVGIDLGTTYSLVSVVEKGRPVIIPVDGGRLMPSIVHYGLDGTVSVGKAAERMREVDPLRTFASVKRLIGRTLAEAKTTGDEDLFKKQLSSVYSSNTSAEMCALRLAGGEPLMPEQILSEVLKKLLKTASEYIQDKDIDNAVITVPAYFNRQQTEAIALAGEMAGFHKIKLLKEPEAAAFAYGLAVKEPQVVMVFDLGGGTFDVSVLEVGGGFVEVIVTNGDAHLGGDDFDALVADWIFRQLVARSSKDLMDKLKSSAVVRNSVLTAAKTAKVSLTSAMQVIISLNETWAIAEKMLQTLPHHYSIDAALRAPLLLTRAMFEKLSAGLLQRMLRPVREAAIMASVNLPGESGLVSQVVGIGLEGNNEVGSETLYEDPEIVQKQGRESAKTRQKIKGSTRQEVNRLKRELSDNSLSQFPSGRGLDDVILVGGATRMPCIVNIVRTLTHIDPKRTIHPDEAVCLGAGVLSGMLDGKIENMQVLNPFQASLLRLLHSHKKEGMTYAASLGLNQDGVVDPQLPSAAELSKLFRMNVAAARQAETQPAAVVKKPSIFEKLKKKKKPKP